jgi:TRAP-type mannitol/chloroaromatic compound transport system substrate-binding protein
MDRRSIIAVTGAASVAGLLAACGKKEEPAAPTAAPAAPAAPAVQTATTLRWRLTSSFPKALDTLFGVSDVFATKVKELSGGKFEITTHAPGELVPAFGTIDAVQAGTVEMASTAPYYYFGKDPTFAIGCAIPFGLNSRQMTAWMMHGNGLKLMREFYAQYNIINFPMGNTGAQMGGWFRKPIKTMDDIKGLKFRTGGFSGKVWERIGGIAANIPGGEIYQSLEKGTIDAAEWVGPYDDLKLGFYKVANNYAYPGFWEGGPQLDLHVNTKAYEGLSSENKAIITAASMYAHTNMQAQYDALNPAALKDLVSKGAKLFPFPQAVMDSAFKEAMALYSELSASNPAWKKIYEDYAEFRRDQNLWFRFTESTFDNFMQRQKL